jgi:hypothetical protein
METLREALERLGQRGFASSFRARPGGLLELPGESPVAPETLVVEEVVRFEGASDPADEAVLFALRSPDGRMRGTFVTSYGARTEPASAEAVHRLDTRSARPT